MSALEYAGCYSLDLYCDSKEHGFSLVMGDYTGETFGECARSARKDGWVIRTAMRTATCPRCSKKLKSQKEKP